MLYLALAITTILAIIFAIAHEEQKLKTDKYRRLAIRLKKENDALKDDPTMREFERLAMKCFSK
jgi:hypothetical protein|nr:MAG TPA: hypothetical protein [Caudoviricetes sp.]